MKHFLPAHSKSTRWIGISITTIFAILICLIVWASSRESTVAFLPITDTEGQTVILFSQGNNNVFLVTQDGESRKAYALNPESGEVRAETLGAESGKAYVLGDSLGISYTDSLTIKIAFWRADISISEAKQNGYMFPVTASNDSKYVYTTDGFLFIAPPEGELKAYYPSLESKGTGTDLEDLEFLSITPDEQVYAYADGFLFRWQGGQFEDPEAWFYELSPAQLVGENAFVDTEGNLFILDNGEILPVLDSLAPLDISCCYVVEDKIYIADPEEGVIHQYDTEGNQIGRFPVGPGIKSLTFSGALVEREGKFWFAPYNFQDTGNEPEMTPAPTPEPIPDVSPTPGTTSIPSEEPSETPTESPSPTPELSPTPSEEPTAEPSETPSPTPESSPSPEPDETESPVPSPTPPLFETVTVDGVEYMLIDDEMTIQELRKQKEPQAVSILDLEGKSVVSGLLKTGMTMDEIDQTETKKKTVIVILGDCDSSGHITVNDLALASYCIMEVESLRSDAAFLAADLDGDGSLTTRDLIQISYLIDKHK